MASYDYLIVGSGLFGATFAHFAKQQGKRILVTRYDINLSPEVQKIFVDYIIETFDRLYGNSANKLYETYAKYGSAAYSMDVQTNDLKHREMCLRQSIESFVKKYMTTTQRADYAKEITKVINFEDVEEEIKSIYNHKYFKVMVFFRINNFFRKIYY